MRQLLGLLLLSIGFVVVACSKRNRQTPPPLVGSEHGHRSRFRRPAECQFAGRTYELQDTWHPDLGPPFGIQYCVRCECVELQKKRRVVGKVHCRNFKSECPNALTCPEPVLLPGQCCKSCPRNSDILEDTHNLPSNLDVADDTKQSNEYAALLTGLGMVPAVTTPIVGSGRFTFAKRHLYYSIYLGRNEQINYVRFVDEGGTILEELEVDMEGHHAKSGKLCGVWRRIPKIYRRILREEKLYVELVSNAHSEGVVRGRLARFRSLSTESFTALLKLPPGVTGAEEGSGGMAIISTMSTTASIIHLQLVFNGIISEKDGLLTTLSVEVSTTERTPPMKLDGLAKVHTPNKIYNTLEWKMELSPRELRTMLSGKTILTISPRNNPDIRLEGAIIPKSTCNVFQAILSSANVLNEYQPSLQSSGLALITINDDTSLNYAVFLHGLSSRLLALTLETNQKKRQSSSYNLIPSVNDSWANGTYSKSTVRDIEMLLADELLINVDTEQYENELRGHITQRMYSEAHASNAPILLTGVDESSAAGQAWLTVDSSCKLAFDIVMVGVGGRAKGSSNTYMLKIVESAPNNARAERLLLAEFTGNEVEDVVEELSKLTLARLDSGVTYLHVTQNSTLGGTAESESVLLRGRINNVRVPLSCLPSNDNTYDDGRNTIPFTETYNCFYEGRLFEDGSQWTAEHDSCMMCSCQRGRVVCEPVICPRPHCNDVVLLSGECCPSCPDNSIGADRKDNMSRGCYFEGDKKWHQAGTIWHPYIPPFGFSVCAVCKCDVHTLQVSCDRITCPSLACPEKDAIRAAPQDCCKVCAVSPSINRTISTKSGDFLKDEGSARNSTDILAEGGCEFKSKVYANGDEWHPRLQTYGVEKCVLCYCKDGIAKCKRQKCPVLTCTNRIDILDQCCQQCTDGSSTATQRHRHKGSVYSKKRRRTKQ